VLGSQQQIHSEVLEGFMEMSPKEALRGKKPIVSEASYDGNKEMNIKTIAAFIVNFGFMAFPDKEKMKGVLQAQHLKRFKELENQVEPDYRHDCVFDLMTVSDLAYVCWQYMNSYDMWIEKRENETLKYKCSTRWTSNRKSAAMENRPDSDPGVAMYNKCLDWARDLKKLKDTRDYADLRIECNKKCCELGYIKVLAGLEEEDALERVSRVDRSSIVEAPWFCIDDIDKIPEYEV
jgi:hypothetical protein